MNDPIELVLAKQANDAIAKGADGNAVTERLHQIIGHLRSNPDLAAQGSEALARGADAGAIANRIYELSQSDSGFRGHGTGRTFDTNAAPTGMIQAGLDAVPFATKGMAAIDAVMNHITGEGPPSYEQNLLNRKAALSGFREQHPKQYIAGTVAGAVGPAVATLGASVPEEGALLAPKAGLLTKVYQGAKTGAGFGILQGASQAHGSLADYEKKIDEGLVTGGVAGAAGSLLGAGASALARKAGLPQKVSSIAANLAAHTEEGGTANRYLRKLAQTFGTRGEATRLVGERTAMDRASGFQPNDYPNGVPMIALDRAGPNTEKLAQGVAHGPAGPGQGILTNTLNRRMAHMKPSVQDAITEGTGVAPNQGMEPLRQLIREQSDEAGRLYGVARAATEGQAVKSPTLDAVMQTPVGRQAYAWAVAQKGNRMSPMPTANAVSPEMQRLIDMGVPEGKAADALGADAYSQEALPDPETLHYMKQYLANVAKLGVRDGSEGKLATQAQGAVSIWGMIRKELPPEWQAADAAFANKAKQIGLMNEGRNIFRTQVNPAGRPRAAVQNSLDAVEQRAAEASPEGQASLRTGVGMAAQTQAQRLGTSVKSPGRIFGGDVNTQRMALGFNDPEKAQQFQRLVSAWDQIQAQKERILGNSATGGRVAEQAARAPDKATASFFGELVRGNFGRALGTVGKQVESASDRAHRVAVDKAIAEILTNPNPNALTEARLSALLQLRLSGAAGKLLPRVAGSEAEIERQ